MQKASSKSVSNKNWDKIVIEDLVLLMSAGIYEHEKAKPQRIIVNVTLDVTTNINASLEDIEKVVSYEEIIKKIESLAAQRHYTLLERFAEDIAQMCLKHSHQIQVANIRVEKPDIISNAGGVGVHIHRTR